jgi:hypothetical protein
VRSKGGALGAIGVIVALVALSGCTKYGATLARPEEPVVLDGSALPKLVGTTPTRVVGFAWDGEVWHQVPVQVDERDLVNPGKILNRPTTAWARNADGTEFKILAYTTPTTAAPGWSWTPTFTGTDSDPNLDANDQVSFLSDDTGQQPPDGTAAPANVVASTREVVTITDPLTPDQTGYLYLYRSSTASLTGGSAGTTGVSYVFSLDSGSYTGTYKMGVGALAPNNVAGFNSEHSTVTTPGYKLSFGDRWLNDGLSITANGASGADVLERGRVQFLPGVCGRSEDTFDGGATNPYEAAFIANISGPVRAIRSYIGANSGQYTTASDIFSPMREDSATSLRVHSIPGVMQFDDFTTGLTGMTYTDDQNSGIPIDGHADAITAAHAAPWQLVSGPAGSIVTTRVLDSDISGLQLSTYYLDQNPASPAPCTGDGAAWGQNGVQILGPGGGAIPCTDPTRTDCPTAAKLDGTRVRYFRGPGTSAATAATLASRAARPLTSSVTG